MTSPARRTLLSAVPLTLVAAFVAVPGLAEAGGSVFNFYNLCAFSSAAIVVGVVRVRRPQPLWPWVLIAAAVMLWAIGDAVITWTGYPSSPSPADGFYLAADVAVIAALLRALRARRGALDRDMFIDIAMAATAMSLTLWVLVVQPTWTSAGVSWPTRIISALYPLMGVIALCIVLQLLLGRGPRLPSLVLLASAMAALVLSGTLVTLLAPATSPLGGRLLAATWLLSYALFAAAALHPSMKDLTKRVPARDALTFGRLIIAGGALLAVPLSATMVAILDRDPGIEAMAAGAFTLVPLVLWRIVRLNKANERARGEIAGRERYYRAVVSKSTDAFVVIDRDAKVLDASPALQTLVGYGPEVTVGADAMEIIEPEDQPLAKALLGDSLAKPGITVSEELRVRNAGGGSAWTELRATNLVDDPAVRGVVLNARNITERKKSEHALEHQAFHDSLTALANRALLKDRIDHALAGRSRGNDVAVVFCDLDGFKVVNDTLGHEGGDEMLKIAAQRLQSAVRLADTVARVGGDEFAVLLEGTSGAAREAGVLAERMRGALSDPALIMGTPLVVTGSFGVAVASVGGQSTSEELLRDADIAMYRAKAAGRNQVALYLPSMRAADLSRAQLAADLALAVEREELVVQYQPIIELGTRRVAGFEALVRWNHPTRGRLQPNDFIAIAEETGAIIDIGMWVLRTACRTASAWQRQLLPGTAFTLNVNLSARQLADPGLVAHVAKVLASTGLPPSALVLELTESLIVERPDEVAAQFHELKALGVQIAIDDFGVGYSSLSYLQQFPVDVLKIDKSFVDSIENGERLPAIVHGLLELARTLELETIAEGIETDIQWHALVNEGCELGQGYLFAPALDVSDATRMFNDQITHHEAGARRAARQRQPMS